MITDENGVKHPETVIEEADLEREEKQNRRLEASERFWNRKARREGWARPEPNQGARPEKEKTASERFFERKALREGWSKNN